MVKVKACLLAEYSNRPSCEGDLPLLLKQAQNDPDLSRVTRRARRRSILPIGGYFSALS